MSETICSISLKVSSFFHPITRFDSTNSWAFASVGNRDGYKIVKDAEVTNVER